MKNNIDSNFAIAILALVAACVGLSFVLYDFAGDEDISQNTSTEAYERERPIDESDATQNNLGLVEKAVFAGEVNQNQSKGIVLTGQVINSTTERIAYTTEDVDFSFTIPKGWDVKYYGTSREFSLEKTDADSFPPLIIRELDGPVGIPIHGNGDVYMLREQRDLEIGGQSNVFIAIREGERIAEVELYAGGIYLDEAEKIAETIQRK